jgi:DNA polymerase II large subunit
MELDKEALNVDAGWYYPATFYEKTLQQPHPKSVQELVDTVENRLEDVGSLRGYGYTHELSALDSGPTNSAYKTLGSMIDKMNAQLELCQTLRAVDVRRVASQVIESHFLPDLRGNLVAFTRQKVRCVRCGASYRRLPLAGKCITETARRGGLHGARDGERERCGNKLVLTVSEGAVRKYIHVMQYVIDTFGTDDYTRQRFEWLTDSVEGLFGNDKVTVFTLDDFL